MRADPTQQRGRGGSKIPWVGVWRWSTYEMSADFSSFFHVSESIRSPVTMSIFICRLCLTPVGELISWIPEAEGSFSLLAPMRLLRNFFMKLMLNALYCLKLLYQKKRVKVNTDNGLYSKGTMKSYYISLGS